MLYILCIGVICAWVYHLHHAVTEMVSCFTSFILLLTRVNNFSQCKFSAWVLQDR